MQQSGNQRIDNPKLPHPTIVAVLTLSLIIIAFGGLFIFYSKPFQNSFNLSTSNQNQPPLISSESQSSSSVESMLGSKSTIKISNSERATKLTNDWNSSKGCNSDQGKYNCGIRDLITYTFPTDISKSPTERSKMIYLANKADYLDSDKLYAFEAGVKVINEKDNKQTISTTVFGNTCSSYADQFIQDVEGVNVPNVDNFRVIAMINAQSAPGQFFVWVYARKGDTLIGMQSPVLSGLAKTDIDYAKECGLNIYDTTGFNMLCYENKLRSPEVEKLVIKVAQELADFYRIQD